MALAAASASSAAQAVEVFPETVSPLQIQQDPNGVNLTTGKITFDVPTLSVPAAPRLKFDRVQNAAPYFKGSVTGAIGETSSGNFSVHTGAASSEAFSCSDGDVCASKTGSGSMFIPTGVGAATYREAGTGAIYDFDSQQVRETMNNPNTTMYYASKITYPDGEVISFTYSKHYVAAQYDPATGFRTPQYYYHRPTKVTSSLGYHITITYLSDTWLDAGWSGPKEVALYQSGNATPLDKLIYDGSITDPGDLADLTDDKVYKCDTACGNYMGGSIEAVEGSLTLPGDTSPSLVVTQHPDTADLSNVRLVGSVTRDGARWTYSYGNLRRDLSSFGRYFYDTVTVTGPNNYRVVYGMRSGGNGNWIESIQERVDASAGLTRLTEIPEYTYHRPKLIVHPEKNEEEVSYDSYGNVVSKITRAKPLSGLANITESARVIDTSMCDMGLSSVLCYRPNVITDGRGNETRYAYNDKGQMTVRTDPLAGGVTRQTRVTYETSTAGTSRKKVVRVCAEATATQPTTCATNDEAWTEYVYWGNTSLPTLERRIDKATGVTLDTKYAYDAAGRLLEVDGPLVSGRQDVIFYRYDSHGRKEWEIGALGANGVRMATRYYYRNSDDKVFRVETGAVAAAEPAVGTAPAFVQVQKRVDTSYNARRKPTREKLVAGGVVQQVTDRAYLLRGDLECEATRMNPNVYDALPVSACDQSVTTETRPHGPDRITRNYYDDAGQLLKVQKGYGMALQQDYATYTYSLNGKRTSVKDANGNLAQMTYDGHDRQFKWIFPNGDFEEYGYDANGNRTSLTKRDGLTLTYTYDALDRMTRKTVPERSGLHPLHTRDVTYTYDLLDHQRSARFVATASTPVEGVTNGYDTLGRMLWSKIDMEGVERVLYHGYDAAGRRTQLTHADGHIVTYAYDPAGRTKGIYEGVGTTTPLATFAYDNLGRLDLRTDAPGSSVDYGYDVIGRLETQTDLFTGGAGNVLTTLAYNPANQIIRRKREDVTGSVGQADLYAWDGHKEVERPYNANTLNQYTAAGPTAFTHEKNGSLASETNSQGATSYTYDVENRLVQATGLNAATFRYDPLGRIFKVGSVTFLYDGDALIGEYSGTGTTATLVERYVHGAAEGVDDPLVWYDGSNKRWLHADHQGSVVAVTAPGGGALWINAYDEYGIPKTSNRGRFQFTGQAWIPTLGMYHYKARIYSPTLGRFLQVDPVGYDDQINLYAYVGNDPVNRTDPTGTYGRGTGWDKDQWRKFNDAQKRTAKDMERRASRLESKAAKLDAKQKPGGDARRQEARSLRDGASALRSDGSDGRMANAVDASTYRSMGGSATGAAIVQRTNLNVMNVNISNPELFSGNNLQWVAGHESLHTAGLQDQTGPNGRFAYARSGEAPELEAFNALKGTPAAHINPDHIMSGVYP